MQCSICEKMFAATLSICPSCGAMQTQYSQAEASLRLLSIEKINTSELQLEIEEPAATEVVSRSAENEFYGNAEQLQQIKRGQTTTLLEFPGKKSKDQEWREEIKNRIRQRQTGSNISTNNDASAAAINTESAAIKTSRAGSSTAESSLVINLKPKLTERLSPKSKDVVAEALKRIERSRQKFENNESVVGESAKTFSLDGSQTDSKKQSETANSSLTLVPRARKVLPMIEDEGLRNHEDKLLIAKTSQKGVFTVPLKISTTITKPKNEVVRETSFDDLDDEETIASSLKSVRKTSVQQALLNDQELVERAVSEQPNRQSNEDYAPLIPRFVAGAIDIALSAASVLALSHFVLGATVATNWLSTAIIFAAILFVYLTAALLFASATVGMRIFGMSVIAAEDGETPTVSQMLIGNAVYLLTLATGGIGLLTVFFSSEQRTLHDLLSGTVIVRQD